MRKSYPGREPTSPPGTSTTRAWTGADRGVPHRAPGAELLGLYQGSAATHATYLVRRGDGQVIQLSGLLHAVLDKIDGVRTTDEAAGLVSAETGRTVSGDNVDYLVSTKLHPLGLVAGADDRDVAQYEGLLTVKVKRTLLPKRLVGVLARLLQPAFHPLIIAVVLAAVVAFDAAMIAGRVLGNAVVQVATRPALFLLAIGLVLLGSLFHECGHAAGCRYGGATPGAIGAGFYVVWPAFYTEVSDSYRLNRTGRIRTDLGGVYFNLIFILGVAGSYLATGFRPLLVAILFVHIEMFRQLLPSLRLDGYWILSDVIGVPDLFGRVQPILLSLLPGREAHPLVRNLKRPARIAITVWVLAVVPMLLVELVLVVVFGPRIAATVVAAVSAQLHIVSNAFSRRDLATGIAAAITVLMMVLPLLGIGYLLLSLGRRGARFALAHGRRRITRSNIALLGWSVVDAGLLAGRRARRLAVAANRRHPVLRYPAVAAVLLVAAALAWGVLPLGGGEATPSHPPEVITASRPQPQPLPTRPQPVSPAHPPKGSPASARAPSGTPAYPNRPLSGSPSGVGSAGTPAGPPLSGSPSGVGSAGTPAGPPLSGSPSGVGSAGTPAGPPLSGSPSGVGSAGTPAGPPLSGSPSGVGSAGTPAGPPPSGSPSGVGSAGTPAGPPPSGSPSDTPSAGTPAGPPPSGSPSDTPSAGTPAGPPPSGSPSDTPSAGTPAGPPPSGRYR